MVSGHMKGNFALLSHGWVLLFISVALIESYLLAKLHVKNKVYDRHSCLSPSFYSIFGHMNTTCKGEPTDGTVPVIPIRGTPQSHESSSANMPKILLLEFCCSLHRITSLPLPCSQKNVGEGGEVLFQLGRWSIRHQQV